MRATQIGVVARGKGCAAFNVPAIYSSVKMNYKWMKETIAKEVENESLC